MKHKQRVCALGIFLWFCLRVLPNPTRLRYPCQRATLSLAFAKIGFSLPAFFSAVQIEKKTLRRLGTLGMLIVLGLPLGVSLANRYNYVTQSSTLQVHVTTGGPRIVRVHGVNAATWDYESGYYWQKANQTKINHMVAAGMMAFTGTEDPVSAWNQILNTYSLGDIVGVKVNGNNFGAPVGELNTLPEVINAVIYGLKSIGVPESDIWVIEPTTPYFWIRLFHSYYYSTIHALYPEVSLLDGNDIGFGAYPELRVVFPYTSAQYITDELAEIDHLIMLPLLKAITPIWGVTGALKMMQGNIEDPLDLHPYLTRTDSTNPIVLIYKNPHIISKMRVIITDGIYGLWTGKHFTGPYGGEDSLIEAPSDIPRPWITFDDNSPNCLFFGTDPVAMDSILYDYVKAERDAQELVPGQKMAKFNEPIIMAGESAGLGTREHGPPYVDIDYIEQEIGELPPPVTTTTTPPMTTTTTTLPPTTTTVTIPEHMLRIITVTATGIPPPAEVTVYETTTIPVNVTVTTTIYPVEVAS